MPLSVWSSADKNDELTDRDGCRRELLTVMIVEDLLSASL
jgi:hypothetical protein